MIFSYIRKLIKEDNTYGAFFIIILIELIILFIVIYFLISYAK